MTTSFRPIAMHKSKLALLYFPDVTLASATNRLMRWIHNCAPLMKELEVTSYHRSQKWLTARQVVLIIAHLGNP